MKFAFIAKHHAVWPVAWKCAALGVSRSGFHAWLTRQPSQRIRDDEAILSKAHASFVASDGTYGTRRVWRDVLAEGVSCGLHRIERIMRENALRARPRRRGLSKDEGERAAASPNLLERRFAADPRAVSPPATRSGRSTNLAWSRLASPCVGSSDFAETP